MNEDYYHYYPVNDLRPHDTDSLDGCPCKPTVNVEDRTVGHNAWDNREFDEIARSLEAE